MSYVYEIQTFYNVLRNPQMPDGSAERKGSAWCKCGVWKGLHVAASNLKETGHADRANLKETGPCAVYSKTICFFSSIAPLLQAKQTLLAPVYMASTSQTASSNRQPKLNYTYICYSNNVRVAMHRSATVVVTLRNCTNAATCRSLGSLPTRICAYAELFGNATVFVSADTWMYRLVWT